MSKLKMDMARFLTYRFMISLLAVISTALGCGVMPAGQARRRSFTVTGFSLPVSMAYSTTANVQAQVPGIASNSAAAQGFVQRLAMQTVFDVLERQARSALLPDALISTILGQVTVNVTYAPLECPAVAITLEDMVGGMGAGKTPWRCIISSNTVTGICTGDPKKEEKCSMPMKDGPIITPVTTNYTTISGTLSTTNIIMANWSTAMWRGVVNRAVRMLSLGPFASNFFSAIATVGEN